MKSEMRCWRRPHGVALSAAASGCSRRADGRTVDRWWRWVIAVHILLAFGGAVVHSQSCSRDEFACEKGGCIPRQDRCNGNPKCPNPQDQSDETKCPLLDDCVLSGGFQCLFLNQSRCLPPEYHCDNYNDCDGGEDEKNCGPIHLQERCEWSDWSSCDAPTCNVQLRHPVVVPVFLPAGFLLNCSTPNETRPCRVATCVDSRDAAGIGTNTIVITACSVIVALLLFGCLLEVLLRRQLKHSAKLAKHDAEQSSNTTTDSADQLHAQEQQILPLTSMLPHSPQSRAVSSQAPQHVRASSSTANGSMGTAETFLESINPQDPAQLVTLHTAEIRRSLRLAVADIERRTDSDRSPSQCGMGMGLAVRSDTVASDRRALLSSIRQYTSSPPQGSTGHRHYDDAQTHCIQCPLCVDTGPAVACRHWRKLPLPSDGNGCHTGTMDTLGIFAGLGDEYHSHGAILGEACKPYHQLLPISADDVASTHRSLSGEYVPPFAGYPTTPASYRAPAAWPSSCNNNNNNAADIVSRDILLLASAALQANGSTCSGLTQEEFALRLNGSISSIVAPDESRSRGRKSSSIDERSSGTSSRHSRSQLAMPCNTPASSYDVCGTSIEDSASCHNPTHLFHPAQLAVSGTA